MGMICETRISFLQGLISEASCEEIIEYISRFYPRLNIDSFPIETIMALMINDKKNVAGQINFSLLEGIGLGVFDQQVSEQQIVDALQFYQNLA
jgi:3-dehydroquinate synthase